jgi:hypothetical protein
MYYDVILCILIRPLIISCIFAFNNIVNDADCKSHGM